MARLEVLERATVALLEGALDAALRREAERSARHLAASVGAFGFDRAARMAREIEQLLETEVPLRQTQILRLAELIVIFRRELERSPSDESRSNHSAADAHASILVVAADRDEGERLALEAAARGMRGEVAVNLPAARGAVARSRPDVVVLDFGLTGAVDAAATLLHELHSVVPPIPALVLAEGNTLHDRMRAASLGAHAFLQKPLSPGEILDAVTDVLYQLRATESTILALDADPETLATLQLLLTPEGMEVKIVDDPMTFWDILEGSSPDLVVLGLDMPQVSGLDICRALRNDARWRELPILFLADAHDPDTMRRAFAARADDYITKPLVGPELVARVTNRLERSQLHRRMTDTDLLTGVASRRTASQRLTQLVRTAARYEDDISLAVVQVDRFQEINDRYGHMAGDTVLYRLGEFLSTAFRGDDVAARWGGSEFLIGMYGMSRRDGTERLAGVLERFRQEVFIGPRGVTFAATCSGAVVHFPEDGTDLQELYRNAEEVMTRVKAVGGDRVVPAGWQIEHDQNGEGRQVDVAVVDHDDALGGLLLHALHTRGYRTEWLKDGQEANAVLGGYRPSLSARVVLLDIDIPGADGYALLNQLTAHRSAGTSRVIVLTNRSTEEDVLRALDFGAFDHVAKPFSLPVLMHRIRRAVDD